MDSDKGRGECGGLVFVEADVCGELSERAGRAQDLNDAVG
jgi:hypothetical protein